MIRGNQRLVIRNLSTDAVLADHAELADGFLSRLAGLLARPSLDEGGALLFPRCRSIHTCFMRFPIDVLFVTTAQGSRKRALIVKVIQRLKPFRIAWAAGADTVIELPAGTVSRTGAKTGELLEITEDRTGR